MITHGFGLSVEKGMQAFASPFPRDLHLQLLRLGQQDQLDICKLLFNPEEREGRGQKMGKKERCKRRK